MSMLAWVMTWDRYVWLDGGFNGQGRGLWSVADRRGLYRGHRGLLPVWWTTLDGSTLLRRDR